MPEGRSPWWVLQWSAVAGFCIGGYNASRRAALQYAAENAVELAGLKSRHDVLTYHRTQNYRIMGAFVRGGLARAASFFAVGLAFCGVREALLLVDSGAARKFSDVAAGAAVGSALGIASNRQKLLHASRGVLLGASGGALIALFKCFGQDARPVNKESHAG